MKKEYLDELYELRSGSQRKINKLLEDSKQPTQECSCNLKHPTIVELDCERSKIFTINEMIEQYIKSHH